MRLGLFCLTALCCLGSLPTMTAQTQASEVIAATKRVKARDFTVTDVQGRAFRLEALKGRVVLVDFWAMPVEVANWSFPGM